MIFAFHRAPLPSFYTRSRSGAYAQTHTTVYPPYVTHRLPFPAGRSTFTFHILPLTPHVTFTTCVMPTTARFVDLHTLFLHVTVFALTTGDFATLPSSFAVAISIRYTRFGYCVTFLLVLRRVPLHTVPYGVHGCWYTLISFTFTLPFGWLIRYYGYVRLFIRYTLVHVTRWFWLPTVR